MSKHLSQLPDISKSIKSLFLIERIEDSIYELNKQESLIAYAIIGARINGYASINKILLTIKDMATDNKEMMYDVIGKRLTDEILLF